MMKYMINAAGYDIIEKEVALRSTTLELERLVCRQRDQILLLERLVIMGGLQTLPYIQLARKQV